MLLLTQLLGHFEHARAKIAAVERREVDGKQNGIEVIPLQGSQGRLFRVGGEAKIANLPLLLRFQEDLHCPVLAKRGVHILLDVRNRVKLVQIQVVRSQTLQRTP